MMSALREALEKLGEEFEEASRYDTGLSYARVTARIRELLAAHPAEPDPRWPGYGVCTAEGRWGQCVFVAGHHEVEDWTPHADRFGRTWNDQPAEPAR